MKNVTYYLMMSCYLCFSGLHAPPVSAEEGAHKHSGHEEKESHDEHDAHDDYDGHHHHQEAALKLSPEQLKEFDILVKSAGPGIIEQYVSVPGEVVVNQDTFSHISARFPGIVKQVKKRIGDRVKANETLAIIESNESLTPYSIKSLIAGTVIDKHATIGELLREEDVAYSVADLSTVWINLSIYQSDLQKVKTGQDVSVSQGHGQRTAQGVISYLSPIIDEGTRTATARVVLPNTDGEWTPGLFVTATINIAKDNVAVRVPLSAIQTIENKANVFIKTNGEFQAKPVEIGKTNDTFAEIISGLEVGQQYVAKHSFTLKAELSKASFGDGHNH